MAKPSIAQSDCDVIVHTRAEILRQCVHIADIGAVINAGLAVDSHPIQTLPLPSITDSAPRPMAVLLPPPMLLNSVSAPTAVFPPPKILLFSAWKPMAVFPLPSRPVPPMLLASAAEPTAVFSPPVVLLKSA